MIAEASRFPLPARRAASMQRAGAERAVLWLVALTPLLWALGLLIPATGLLVLWLALRAIRSGAPLHGLAVAWFMVAAAQAVSILVNGFAQHQAATFMLYRLVSSGVSGWIVLGLCFTVGAHFRLASRGMVRALAILGVYQLVLGAGFIAAYYASGRPQLVVPTPVAAFLPASAPAQTFSFSMHLFSSEDLLGRQLPRISLFYPWTVVLGFAGIAVTLVAARERSLALRIAAMSGGLLALVASGGRAPLLAFAVVLSALALLRAQPRELLAVALAAVLAGAVMLPLELSPQDVLRSAYAAFTDLRPGSSNARELGYAASMLGFMESPLLGQGWVGENVAEGIPLPIGSHSSVYGILYTGGVLTFGAFVIALAATLLALLRRARSGGPLPRTAFAIVLALTVLAYGEALYSFVLPCLPLFLFVGGALAAPDGATAGGREALYAASRTPMAAGPLSRAAWVRAVGR